MVQIWRIFGNDIIVSKMLMFLNQNKTCAQEHVYTHDIEVTIQQSERECFSAASHGTERAVCKYLHRLGDLVFPKLCA